MKIYIVEMDGEYAKAFDSISFTPDIEDARVHLNARTAKSSCTRIKNKIAQRPNGHLYPPVHVREYDCVAGSIIY